MEFFHFLGKNFANSFNLSHHILLTVEAACGLIFAALTVRIWKRSPPKNVIVEEGNAEEHKLHPKIRRWSGIVCLAILVFHFFLFGPFLLYKEAHDAETNAIASASDYSNK